MRTLLFALVVAGPLISSAALAQESVTAIVLDDELEAELLDGDHYIDTETGRLNRGEVIGLVRAPMQDVYDIIMDFDNESEWFPDEEESEILRTEGDSIIGRGRTNVPWPIADRHWEVRTTPSTETLNNVECYVIRFEYIEGSGNLDEMHGYWVLRPYGDNNEFTLVKYVLNVDLGIALPRAILNWAGRSMFPGIIDGLNDRYEELN